MSTTYRYQETFASELAAAWVEGKQEHVRLTVRGLKNKAQAAYIASLIALLLTDYARSMASEFVEFIHPQCRESPSDRGA